jgi:hypothetical protein
LIYHDQFKTFSDIFINPFASLLVPHQERFRPIYILLLRLFSHTYGLHPVIWYLSSFAIANLTTFAFYLFARRLEFATLESCCLALLVMFGNQASTYARFGTPETTAMLFIALALLFASQKSIEYWSRLCNSSAFISFAILAALNKEACILMLPALGAFKIWFYMREQKCSLDQSIQANKYTLLVLLMVFSALMAYIKYMGVSGPGYAGISADTFSAGVIKNLFKTLINSTSLMLALVLNALYLWALYKSGKRKDANWIGYLLLGLLIVLPQLILYAKSGIEMHYLFPTVIGIALLTIYPLAELKKFYPKLIQVATILMVGLILYRVVGTYTFFRNTAAVTKSIREMSDDLRAWAGTDSEVIVFGNSLAHFEKLYGFKTMMDKVEGNPSVYLALYGSKEKEFQTNVFHNEEARWSFLNSRDLNNCYDNKTFDQLSKKNPENLRTIVVLSYAKFHEDYLALTKSWFDPNQYVRKDYPEIDMSVYHAKP